MAMTTSEQQQQQKVKRDLGKKGKVTSSISFQVHLNKYKWEAHASMCSCLVVFACGFLLHFFLTE